VAAGDSLWSFGAAAMMPAATNYGQFVSANAHLFVAFDTTTQETVLIPFVVPEHYAGGDVDFTAKCCMQSATSGTASLGISLQKSDDASTDIDAGDSFDTETLATPVTVPGTAGIMFNITITVPAADMDGLAAGDMGWLRLRRDVANDTATGDLRVEALNAVES